MLCTHTYTCCAHTHTHTHTHRSGRTKVGVSRGFSDVRFCFCKKPSLFRGLYVTGTHERGGERETEREGGTETGRERENLACLFFKEATGLFACFAFVQTLWVTLTHSV